MAPEGGTTHLHIGDTCVNICYAGNYIHRVEAAGLKWCFRCRERTWHSWYCVGDPPRVLTYYEPSWECRCSQCGRDHTRFPW